ncbi:MAG: glutamate-1-semialdehyde 2,1-aminomutase, partial [Candidatus Sumerlaeia bacterium]|nr:glutamate-1-semialdehyde 2,1-aminomutase [Candidatus Sumerlaeia bacterium]
ATMSAIRLARAFTGRELLVKFEGCYHGHGDAFLSKAGSGAATFGQPTSPGVPKATAAATLNAQFNDLASVEECFAHHRGQVAAIIVEPVVGNMGCVPPSPGFLQGLRELCTREGALLIFDEVMTGFRLGLSGAQGMYGVTPDITTLGKVIGGGLPVGAYGGRSEIMSHVSPVGAMYQAGTLSGNPLGMAAGLATLRHLIAHPEIFSELDARCGMLESLIREHQQKHHYPITLNRVGSMLTIFFTKGPVTTWSEASSCDTERFGRFFHAMLNRGVHLPPAQYEAWFMSIATTPELFRDLGEQVCSALDEIFAG